MSRRNKSRSESSRIAHAAQSVCEMLESRRMFSTISWNRGTEGFGALFGANAELARTIVDRAIIDWQNVITSFNDSLSFVDSLGGA